MRGYPLITKLTVPQRVQIIALLCEGSSLRAISRVTGISFNTVSKLLVDAGKVCEAHHDETLRSTRAERVQRGKIWSFVYVKKCNVEDAKAAREGACDAWIWTAIDADGRLAIS